jgi:hypothetical protein
MTHELKSWPALFEPVYGGHKKFDVRNDDRGFKIGDVLHFREWRQDKKEYTGREIDKRVTYILRNFGLLKGWCCMSLEDYPRPKSRKK